MLEYRALLELYHDLRAEQTGWAQRIQAVLFHQGATRLGEAGVVGPQARARLERLAAAQLTPVGQVQVATALVVMDTLAEQCTAGTWPAGAGSANRVARQDSAGYGDGREARRRDVFGSIGIVRVDRAFPAGVADAVSELIWGVFQHSFGIERSRPETWGPFRKRPLERIVASPWFDEILTDRLAVVIDDLLGVGSWDWPAHWGDFLITFPNATTWSLPHDSWHQDWSFDVDCDPPTWCKGIRVPERGRTRRWRHTCGHGLTSAAWTLRQWPCCRCWGQGNQALPTPL